MKVVSNIVTRYVTKYVSFLDVFPAPNRISYIYMCINKPQVANSILFGC